MAVSVRLDPLMEKELELSAKQQGITKSQFIIAALERALGRKNPYALLMQVKAEAALDPDMQQLRQVFASEAAKPYDTTRSREELIAKLRAKHGLSAD
jgi:RHH-type rel operon transcriptional repressor/antitoxin RelB